MEVVKDLSVEYPEVSGKCYFIFVYKSCTRVNKNSWFGV